MKSGNLNFLEPSGPPLHAYNGTDLSIVYSYTLKAMKTEKGHSYEQQNISGVQTEFGIQQSC